ncbi:MAG: DUF3147 family protein [Candidatus Peregrinibacteria bacterium]
MFYALQFLFGGLSVIGITLLAKFVDPRYTGIVYALPIVLITAMIFIYLDQGIDIVRQSLWSTFAYEFTLLAFPLVFVLLLSRFAFWWSLTFALLIWLLSALSVYVLTKTFSH